MSEITDQIDALLPPLKKLVTSICEMSENGPNPDTSRSYHGFGSSAQFSQHLKKIDEEGYLFNLQSSFDEMTDYPFVQMLSLRLKYIMNRKGLCDAHKMSLLLGILTMQSGPFHGKIFAINCSNVDVGQYSATNPNAIYRLLEDQFSVTPSCSVILISSTGNGKSIIAQAVEKHKWEGLRSDSSSSSGGGSGSSSTSSSTSSTSSSSTSTSTSSSTSSTSSTSTSSTSSSTSSTSTSSGGSSTSNISRSFSFVCAEASDEDIRNLSEALTKARKVLDNGDPKRQTLKRIRLTNQPHAPNSNVQDSTSSERPRFEQHITEDDERLLKIRKQVVGEGPKTPPSITAGAIFYLNMEDYRVIESLCSRTSADNKNSNNTCAFIINHVDIGHLWRSRPINHVYFSFFVGTQSLNSLTHQDPILAQMINQTSKSRKEETRGGWRRCVIFYAIGGNTGIVLGQSNNQREDLGTRYCIPNSPGGTTVVDTTRENGNGNGEVSNTTETTKEQVTIESLAERIPRLWAVVKFAIEQIAELRGFKVAVITEKGCNHAVEFQTLIETKIQQKLLDIGDHGIMTVGNLLKTLVNSHLYSIAYMIFLDAVATYTIAELNCGFDSLDDLQNAITNNDWETRVVAKMRENNKPIATKLADARFASQRTFATESSSTREHLCFEINEEHVAFACLICTTICNQYLMLLRGETIESLLLEVNSVSSSPTRSSSRSSSSTVAGELTSVSQPIHTAILRGLMVSKGFLTEIELAQNLRLSRKDQSYWSGFDGQLRKITAILDFVKLSANISGGPLFRVSYIFKTRNVFKLALSILTPESTLDDSEVLKRATDISKVLMGAFGYSNQIVDSFLQWVSNEFTVQLSAEADAKHSSICSSFKKNRCRCGKADLHDDDGVPCGQDHENSNMAAKKQQKGNTKKREEKRSVFSDDSDEENNYSSLEESSRSSSLKPWLTTKKTKINTSSDEDDKDDDDDDDDMPRGGGLNSDENQKVAVEITDAQLENVVLNDVMQGNTWAADFDCQQEDLSRSFSSSSSAAAYTDNSITNKQMDVQSHEGRLEYGCNSADIAADNMAAHIASAIEENPKIETTNLPLQNSVVPKPLDIDHVKQINEVATSSPSSSAAPCENGPGEFENLNETTNHLSAIETTNRLSAIACGLCSSDKAALEKIESINLSLGSSDPIEAFKSVFGYDAFSEFSIEIGAYGPYELLQSVLSSLRNDSGHNGPAKRERKKARKGD